MGRLGKTILVLFVVIIVGAGSLWYWAKNHVGELLVAFYNHAKMEHSYDDKKVSGFPLSLEMAFSNHKTKGMKNITPITTESELVHVYASLLNHHHIKMVGTNEVVTFPLPIQNPLTKEKTTEIKLKIPKSTAHITFTSTKSLKKMDASAENLVLALGDADVVNIGRFHTTTDVTHQQGNEEHSTGMASLKDISLAGFLSSFGVKIDEIKLEGDFIMHKDDASIMHFKSLAQDSTLTILWGGAKLKLTVDASALVDGDKLNVKLKKFVLNADGVKKLIAQPPFTLFLKKEDTHFVDETLARLKTGDDAYTFTLPNEVETTLNLNTMHMSTDKPAADTMEAPKEAPLKADAGMQTTAPEKEAA